MGISSTCVFFNLIFEKSLQKKQPIYLILHLLIVARHFGFHGAQNLPTDPTDPTDPTTDPTTTTRPWARHRDGPWHRRRSPVFRTPPRGLARRWVWNDFFCQTFVTKWGKVKKKQKQRRHNCLGKTKEELWIMNLIQDDGWCDNAVKSSFTKHVDNRSYAEISFLPLWKKLAWPCFVILNFPPPQRTFAKVCRNQAKGGLWWSMLTWIWVACIKVPHSSSIVLKKLPASVSSTSSTSSWASLPVEKVSTQPSDSASYEAHSFLRHLRVGFAVSLQNCSSDASIFQYLSISFNIFYHFFTSLYYLAST